jgi:DnaK suppressor protein
MAVIWIEEPEDRRMAPKKIKDTRRRLSSEYENLITSINRNRLAAEQIKLENTEDEGDLATISHDRELLYHLHESDFQRLRCIQKALKALDRGQYGDCVRCGEDINEKRLLAVPWAAMCIRCQEETEKDRNSSDLVMAGLAEETEL